MGQPRPHLSSAFNFYNKYVKNVHPVDGAGIWTHDFWNMTTRPGLTPKSNLI